MWELPHDAAEILQKIRDVAGNEVGQTITENLQSMIQILPSMFCGTLLAGPVAPILAVNIYEGLGKIAKENLSILNSVKPS